MDCLALKTIQGGVVAKPLGGVIVWAEGSFQTLQPPSPFIVEGKQSDYQAVRDQNRLW